MEEINFLEWDSSFFGYKIGLIELNNYNENFIDSLLIKAKIIGYKLIYIRDLNKINFSKSLLEKFDISLVDTKILYCKDLIMDNVNCYSTLISPNDRINEIYMLAFESGKYSRYLMDAHFSQEEFEKLYRTWVDNSISGLIADNIFVFKENNEICGFTTIKYYKDYSNVGLIAVSKNYRGKRVGSDLVKKVEIESLKRGCQRIEVATQIKNIGACKFYEKLEFHIKEVTNIYHVWL